MEENKKNSILRGCLLLWRCGRGIHGINNCLCFRFNHVDSQCATTNRENATSDAQQSKDSKSFLHVTRAHFMVCVLIKKVYVLNGSTRYFEHNPIKSRSFNDCLVCPLCDRPGPFLLLDLYVGIGPSKYGKQAHGSLDPGIGIFRIALVVCFQKHCTKLKDDGLIAGGQAKDSARVRNHHIHIQVPFLHRGCTKHALILRHIY